MKKTNNKLFHSLLIVFFFLTQAGAAYLPAPLAEETSLSFKDLGSADVVMHGPFDTGNIRFNLPAQWALTDGAHLQLSISAFYSGQDGTQVNNDSYLGAMLDVLFNGKLQQSLPLKSGTDIIYTLPIRVEDLPSPNPDGSLEISFYLDASIDCYNQAHHTTVLISSGSTLFLPYTNQSLNLDLRRLPQPFYEPLSIVKKDSPLLVIVPDNANASDMRAALITVAAFGRISGGGLPARLITVAQFTPELHNLSDIVFVGKPDGIPFLSQLTLPIPLDNEKFLSAQIQSEDGVLLLVHSPWDETKSVMVVSGNTDTAVVKAAQAFSSGNVQSGLEPEISVIADVKPGSDVSAQIPELALFNSPDISLGQLGYGVVTNTSVGLNWFSYNITIPIGSVPTEDPYFDIVFSNSALVDPARSGFAVYLNSNQVGSALIPDNTNGITTVRIDLLASSLRQGQNKIDIAANLIPRDVCSITSFSGLWMTVFPESSIHMPLGPAPVTDQAGQDLRLYPAPFTNDPSLSTTMFVLPPKDIASWSVAGEIAYDIGTRATGSILSPEVVFDGTSAQPIDQTRNLIMVGVPQELSLVYEMKDNLPAAYEDGTNVAIVKGQQVVYRIAPNKDLGYLQLFAPSWDDKLTVLGVLGTSSNGVGFAGHALVDPTLRRDIKGNFATVDGDQVISLDTRTGSGTGLLAPNLGPAVSIEKPATSEPSQTGDVVDVNATRRAILPILIGIAILMVVVAAAAFFLRRRNTENTQ